MEFRGGQFFGPRRPIHLPLKFVTPRTNRNRNMWRCSTLHDAQFFLITALRSNGQQDSTIYTIQQIQPFNGWHSVKSNLKDSGTWKEYCLTLKLKVIILLRNACNYFINDITYLLTHLLTYLLTPCSRVLLEKLIGFAANQEIPRIL